MDHHLKAGCKEDAIYDCCYVNHIIQKFFHEYSYLWELHALPHVHVLAVMVHVHVNTDAPWTEQNCMSPVMVWHFVQNTVHVHTCVGLGCHLFEGDSSDIWHLTVLGQGFGIWQEKSMLTIMFCATVCVCEWWPVLPTFQVSDTLQTVLGMMPFTL